MAGFSGIRVAAVLAFALAACGSAQMTTVVAPIPGLAGKPAGYDDIEIDQVSHTVYVADRTDKGVDVFDVSNATPKFLKTITLPDAPNGLAVAHDLGRVYAGTGAGAIDVIDPLAGKVVSEIKTGAKDVDLIDVAPTAGLLIASTGAAGTVLTINLSQGKVVSTAKVGKPLEQPRYNPTDHLVYVSVPDLDAMAVIDPTTGTLTKTLKLGGCIPRGFAIKPGTMTAVVACRKSVMVTDLASGKSTIVGKVADADIVQYYPSVDRFFAAAPHSQVPTLVGMYGGESVKDIGLANVDGGGAAAVYDATNDLVYTTDGRAGHAGLTGFHMDGSRPVPLWQSAASSGAPLLLLLLLIVPIWWFIGRKADPINRPRKAPAAPPERLHPSP